MHTRIANSIIEGTAYYNTCPYAWYSVYHVWYYVNVNCILHHCMLCCGCMHSTTTVCRATAGAKYIPL